MKLNSPLVRVSLLIAAAVAALSGCVGSMPEEEGQTLMTIRGSEEAAPAVVLTPAEKAAQNASEFYRVREIGKAIENYEKAINLDPEYVEPDLDRRWCFGATTGKRGNGHDQDQEQKCGFPKHTFPPCL